MDKKNTILLTVIAVATLLVAVVGATFAFFTAQNNGKAETKVEVKTETTDSLTFGSFEPLFLVANQQNFANVNGDNSDEHVGSQKAVSTGTIEFKRGANSETEYCYTAKLKVTSNNFVYAPQNMEFGEEDQDGRNADGFKRKRPPELLLKVTKTTNSSAVDGSNTTVNYTEPLGANGANGCSKDDEPANTACVYYESLSSDRKICTQNNKDKTSIDQVQGSNIEYVGKCEEQQVAGFDVTILNNSSVESGSYTIDEIAFPTEANGNVIYHKLTATNDGDTVTDTWTAELVFVNFGWDQQYNASESGSPKSFIATWNFEKSDSCS